MQKELKQNILKDYLEIHVRMWDDIKMDVKETSFVFRQLFTATWGKAGF